MVFVDLHFVSVACHVGDCMTFFKFRDILRACTLPAVLVTSSDLSLSGNEAEEDEEVGMYVVPNTLTTRHGRQIRAVVRLDL